MDSTPLIVGIGGTARPNSSSELALRACLAAAEARGARTLCLAGDDLALPLYDGRSQTAASQRLVEALRQCDGLVISSPSYHGGVSGALKNALDHAEDLRQDRRPYLDGRAVGTIVCAYGAQALGTTLVGLRCIVHALRGWPTPMGAGINSEGKVFDADGRCVDAVVQQQLDLVARQVVEFALMQRWAHQQPTLRDAA